MVASFPNAENTVTYDKPPGHSLKSLQEMRSHLEVTWLIVADPCGCKPLWSGWLNMFERPKPQCPFDWLVTEAVSSPPNEKPCMSKFRTEALFTFQIMLNFYQLWINQLTAITRLRHCPKLSQWLRQWIQWLRSEWIGRWNGSKCHRKHVLFLLTNSNIWERAFMIFKGQKTWNVYIFFHAHSCQMLCRKSVWLCGLFVVKSRYTGLDTREKEQNIHQSKLIGYAPFFVLLIYFLNW